MQPCQEQNKSFFDQLQNIEGLDLRDTRGLRHELRIVLLGVTMAILECIKKCGADVSRASEVKKLTVRLTI